MPNRDILGIFLLSVMLSVIVLVTDITALRILVGVPFVFFLTGHALLRVIGPIRVSLVEHTVYACGASIGICVLGGFILNGFTLLTPFGWGLWMIVVTGLLLVVSFIRGIGPFICPAVTWPRLARWQIAVMVLSVFLAGSAYGLAVKDESEQREFKFTQFWLVPTNAYGSLWLGIRSYEDKPERFNIVVSSADMVLARWNDVEIVPGASWTKQISVGDAPRIEARLYRSSDHALYRRVWALPKEVKK